MNADAGKTKEAAQHVTGGTEEEAPSVLQSAQQTAASDAERVTSLYKGYSRSPYEQPYSFPAGPGYPTSPSTSQVWPHIPLKRQ